MAAWQFDIHMLPAGAVFAYYRTTPIKMSRGDLDNRDWWNGIATPSTLRADLKEILPPLNSWSSSIERWGYEDGDRIDVISDNGAIASIFVRVDVRNLSYVFLVPLLEFARRNDLLLRTQDERVVRPSMSGLLSAIRKSDTFRFVKDPIAFFEALERAAQYESDEGAT